MHNLYLSITMHISSFALWIDEMVVSQGYGGFAGLGLRWGTASRHCGFDPQSRGAMVKDGNTSNDAPHFPLSLDGKAYPSS